MCIVTWGREKRVLYDKGEGKREREHKRNRVTLSYAKRMCVSYEVYVMWFLTLDPAP